MGSIGEQVYWAANDNRVDELREGHCLAWLPLVPWAAQRPRATRTLVNHCQGTKTTRAACKNLMRYFTIY